MGGGGRCGGVPSLDDQEEARKKGQVMVGGVQVYGEKEGDLWWWTEGGGDARLHILLQDNDPRVT